MNVLILVILLLLVVYLITPRQELEQKPSRRCPPHEWYIESVLDINGNKQEERITCKHCGPLQDSINE